MSAVPQFPAANDPDALETQEWLDALEAVLEREGPERAHYLLERLIDKARRSGAYIPFSPNTAYINTIPPHMEERSPGNVALEERIRSICRWNAMVMVARANKNDDELGGHIASFASSARCSAPGSSISGTRRTTGTAAISSTSRATRRRACTRARSWREGFHKTDC